jgi:hypothetical protein
MGKALAIGLSALVVGATGGAALPVVLIAWGLWWALSGPKRRKRRQRRVGPVLIVAVPARSTSGSSRRGTSRGRSRR